VAAFLINRFGEQLDRIILQAMLFPGNACISSKSPLQNRVTLSELLFCRIGRIFELLVVIGVELVLI
jgi:hypothetical protein